MALETFTGLESELETPAHEGELGQVLAELEAGQTGPNPGQRTITAPAVYIMAGRPFQVLNRFAFDRSNPTADHLAIISGIACEIVASISSPTPVETVVLQGHTDGIGTVDYDFALGMRRAEATQTRLRATLETLRPGITQRVDLVAQSSGKEEPAASNSAPNCRALNRRVEVYLIRKAAPAGFPFDQILRFLRRLGIPISADGVRTLAARKEVVVGGRSTQYAQTVLSKGHGAIAMATRAKTSPPKRPKFVCPCDEKVKFCAVFLPAKICVCVMISLFPPAFKIKVCGYLPEPLA